MTEQQTAVGEEIKSVADLLERLTGTRATGGIRWYRGQRDFGWNLTPRVARNPGFIRHELDMLKQFKQNGSYRLVARPQSVWEWITIAQHYGLPTRLLDWSENPLVALYFAAENPIDSPSDGALFELDPANLNAAAFDEAPDVVMLDEDDFLLEYLPNAPKGPKRGPLAVVAGRTFDRIIAQSGTFTLGHSVKSDVEKVNDGGCVSRIRVPVASKPRILAELSDMNINASTVYPDLTSLADHLKDIYQQ
ncbi:FRG domain-containing protein [Mycobacterium sp. 1245805.9]|uniref:FRG domain-containing protein n=1 Tax=Mycobacterium sp. 1245805.9 TaxID=1856862 RepID=UPI000B267DBB|nr:FRG domain-containing protein [Mycobacterium sp. 1245805.9]